MEQGAQNMQDSTPARINCMHLLRDRLLIENLCMRSRPLHGPRYIAPKLANRLFSIYLHSGYFCYTHQRIAKRTG